MEKPPDRPPNNHPGSAAIWKSQMKRWVWIEHFRIHVNVREASKVAGVDIGSYRRWRTQYHDFAAEVDAIKRENKVQHYGIASNPISEMDPKEMSKLDFVAFRKLFFKIDTPPFQQEIIDAYESTELGRIMMILIPPEHGKTTLFEDYAAWKLAMDPSFRFTVGSESQQMARKILTRVKLRMDPNGPFPLYVSMFGPFIPQTKTRRGSSANADSAIRQPWGADFFNVYKKSDHDERDFSMVALGVGSQVAGTRTDHLHLDDVMSMNNISQAETVAAKIRQDWLSRPGQRGRTTINGTRVDINDVYEIFERELSERVLSVVRMPAIVDRGDGPEPLWPWDEDTGTGWTMEMLSRQRELVGDPAWFRNYMQQPQAAGEATFTEASLDRCSNPGRSQTYHEARFEDGPIVIGLDPNVGGLGAIAVTQFQSDKLLLLESVQTKGMTSYQEIMRRVEALALRWSQKGATLSSLVIEQNAFQKGLIRDDTVLGLRDRYGLRIVPHTTSKNKYDDDIGVASMASSFLKGDIDLPWADDELTRFNTGDFRNECLSWRPKISGTRLRQDRLMAFWFCWIEWRKLRRAGIINGTPTAVTGPGLPYAPTEAVNLLGHGGRYDAA